VNLLRVCILAALLSLSQAGFSLICPSGFVDGAPTVLQRIWAMSFVPAIVLSYAVLPEDYTRLHCFDEGPAHQDLVARSTFVVAHAFFWTTFAAAAFLLVRFYRGGTQTPRRRWVHIGLVSLGAAVAPLLVLWIYFLVSGSASRRNMEFDIFAVAVSALIGCAVLSILPVTVWRRILIVALYCPLAFYALIFCSRLIALRLFGDRL
jgi:hypothetical protein